MACRELRERKHEQSEAARSARWARRPAESESAIEAGTEQWRPKSARADAARRRAESRREVQALLLDTSSPAPLYAISRARAHCNGLSSRLDAKIGHARDPGRIRREISGFHVITGGEVTAPAVFAHAHWIWAAPICAASFGVRLPSASARVRAPLPPRR